MMTEVESIEDHSVVPGEAQPNSVRDSNADALQALMNSVNGSRKLHIPSKVYEYSKTLMIPDGGLHLVGNGVSDDANAISILKFIPRPGLYSEEYDILPNAMELQNDKDSGYFWSSGIGKITMRDFWLTGTSHAGNGLCLLRQGWPTIVESESKYFGIVENVRITGFDALAPVEAVPLHTHIPYYGICLTNAYEFIINRCRIEGTLVPGTAEKKKEWIPCDSGIYVGSFSNTTRISHCWIGHFKNYGVHLRTYGSVTVSDCIIDFGVVGVKVDNPNVMLTSEGKPKSIGYDIRLKRLHIEDTERPMVLPQAPCYDSRHERYDEANPERLDPDARCRIWVSKVRFNKHDTFPKIPDNIDVFLDNNSFNLEYDRQHAVMAGLGTVWNTSFGHILPPTAVLRDDEALLGKISPIICVMAETESDSLELHGFGSNAAREFDGFYVCLGTYQCSTVLPR